MGKLSIVSQRLILILLITVLSLTPNIMMPLKNRRFRSEQFMTLKNGDVVHTRMPIPPPPPVYKRVLAFNTDMIDVENVTNSGDGVYVAVLDTGLGDIWPELFHEERIAVRWARRFTYESVKWDCELGDFVPIGNMIEDGNFITDPWGNGHGTLVTSSIIGYDMSGFFHTYHVTGIAPNATIIPIQVIDTWFVEEVPDEVKEENPYHPYYTFGFDDMVSAGINYVADLARKEKIKIVINLSIGSVVPVPKIEDAINRAVRRGVIVVAAAGNEGYKGMSWPAAYPKVISSGAVGWTLEFYGHEGIEGNPDYWLEDVPENLHTTDVIGNNFQAYLTNFSSRPNLELGQSWIDLDVCAPGAAIVGQYMIEGTFNWAYYITWGTSLSAPHVAGIAALILESHPHLKQHNMERILKVASAFNPLPKWGEPASAIIFSVFTDTFIEVTWGPRDYGCGLLQADAAMYVADHRMLLSHSILHQKKSNFARACSMKYALPLPENC